MIFYYAPKTIALASHIALEEAELDYEARRLDFAATEQQSRAYLGVNPKGRVPALDTGQGILTETPAILAYIAQIAGNANLAPVTEPFAFARLQEFNLYLCATVHVAHAHRVRGYRWADDPRAIEAMQQRVPANMRECFRLIEDKYFKGPWVMGENYSICDPYLFTISNWLEGDGVDVQEFPRIAAHFHTMRERPVVRRVLLLHGL
jgi:glutathione S-transferase